MRHIGNIIKVLFVMYFVTFALLLALAFVMYKFEPGEIVFQVWIIAVYILSGFAGGFVMGKVTKNKKFIWGCVTGLSYFMILLVVSLVLHRGIDGDLAQILTTAILCAASGTVGGMIS